MGAEAFVVYFIGVKTTQTSVKALLAEGFRRTGKDTFVREDWELIAEAMILQDSKISLRFAICHPPSADSAFTELARRLAVKLASGIKIMEDLPDGVSDQFEASKFADFREVALAVISEKRMCWRADFGEVEGRLTCEAALRSGIEKRAARRTPQKLILTDRDHDRHCTDD